MQLISNKTKKRWTCYHCLLEKKWNLIKQERTADTKNLTKFKNFHWKISACWKDCNNFGIGSVYKQYYLLILLGLIPGLHTRFLFEMFNISDMKLSC